VSAEQTTTTETTSLPPLTAEEFAGDGGYTFRGVTLVEDENGNYVSAWGHIDPETFAAAVRDFDDEMAGPIDEDDRCRAEDVRHRWAVTIRPADDPSGWYMRFPSEITADTLGAFPITVVSR